MTAVFIGGSRRMTRLHADVRARLDRIIEKRLPVLIGDANGVDKAVQSYLAARSYPVVEVFASGEPRNNLGGWPVRTVTPTHGRRDFDYFATKDREMALRASVGLMLWDGESKGTLLNILRLLTQNKITVVYVGPRRAFAEVRQRSDFDVLVSDLAAPAEREFREQAIREGLDLRIASSLT